LLFENIKNIKIMGLPKGRTNNPGGKPKGATSKVNRDLKASISLFLENNWAKIEKDIKALDPFQRVQIYERLLSYSLPRLKSIDQTIELTQKLDGLSDQQLHALIDKILEEDTK
jgi:hypothetical protein